MHTTIGLERNAAFARSADFAVLRSIAADGSLGHLSAVGWRELDELAADWADLPPMPDLVARPAPVPAFQWHLAQLRALADGAATKAENVATAKRRYHARCLFRLLMPGDATAQLSVTLLIPVYNRAALTIEAVESCLRQSWRPLEILVIDDGSTDDLAAALRPFGASVRLIRKPNGGVSSARNLGIRLATGDFIHFLDSDDLLLPDDVARKVEAFLRVPDAEFCFGQAEDHAPNATSFTTKISPTDDLLSACRRYYPFLVPTVMMPRWVMLDAPPFEEDLRRAEDTRYWFRLGMRGTKAIEVRQISMIRRRIGPSLSDLRFHSEDDSLAVCLRDLRDVLASPAHWRYAPGYYMRLATDAVRYRSIISVDGILTKPLQQLRAVLEELATGRRQRGLSPLPLWAALRLEDDRWGEGTRAHRLGGDLGDFFSSVPAMLDAGLRASAPLEPADIQYWVSDASTLERPPHVDYAFRMMRFHRRNNAADRAVLTSILRNVRLPLEKRKAKRFRRLRRLFRSNRIATRLTWGALDP